MTLLSLNTGFFNLNRFSSRITKKKSVQILDHLGLLLEVAVAQVQAVVVVGHVVDGRANQMHFMLVVDERDLTLPKPIEIQVQKDHIQRDFISFQKRK